MAAGERTPGSTISTVASPPALMSTLESRAVSPAGAASSPARPSGAPAQNSPPKLSPYPAYTTSFLISSLTAVAVNLYARMNYSSGEGEGGFLKEWTEAVSGFGSRLREALDRDLMQAKKIAEATTSNSERIQIAARLVAFGSFLCCGLSLVFLLSLTILPLLLLFLFSLCTICASLIFVAPLVIAVILGCLTVACSFVILTDGKGISPLDRRMFWRNVLPSLWGMSENSLYFPASRKTEGDNAKKAPSAVPANGLGEDTKKLNCVGSMGEKMQTERKLALGKEADMDASGVPTVPTPDEVFPPSDEVKGPLNEKEASKVKESDVIVREVLAAEKTNGKGGEAADGTKTGGKAGKGSARSSFLPMSLTWGPSFKLTK